MIKSRHNKLSASIALFGLGFAITGAQVPENLQIQGPLRLTITASQRLVITPGDKEAYIAYWKASNEKYHKEQNLPKERQEENERAFLSSIEVQSKPEAMVVDYLTDGKRFVYTQKPKDEPADIFTKPMPVFTLLFDGKEFFQISGGGKAAMIGNEAFGRFTEWLVFPGLGLPSSPLLKDASDPKKEIEGGFKPFQVPSLLFTSPNSRFGYQEGWAKLDRVDGVVRVSGIVGGDPAKEHEEWKFDGYDKVDGQWVSHKVVWTEFVQKAEGGKPIPFRERSYVVESLKQTAPDGSEFTLKKNLNKGARLTEFRDHKRLDYDFDPELTLDEMRKHPIKFDEQNRKALLVLARNDVLPFLRGRRWLVSLCAASFSSVARPEPLNPNETEAFI